MSRDELVAALKAERTNLSDEAEKLAEALEVMLDIMCTCGEATCEKKTRARAAFLQSLTGTTTPREE